MVLYKYFKPILPDPNRELPGSSEVATMNKEVRQETAGGLSSDAKKRTSYNKSNYTIVLFDSYYKPVNSVQGFLDAN